MVAKDGSSGPWRNWAVWETCARAHVGGDYPVSLPLVLDVDQACRRTFCCSVTSSYLQQDGSIITGLNPYKTGGNLSLNIIEAVFDICKAFRRQNLHIVSTADSLHSTVIVGRQGPVKTYSSVNLL